MDFGYNPLAANAERPAHRLSPLVNRWKGALRAAKKERKDKFDNVADEARNFFAGPDNYMWVDMAKQAAQQHDQGFLAGTSLLPQFKISVNRMFDAVAMFGPSLYHQNPTIAVTARSPLSVSIDTFYAHDQQATQLLRMIPDMQAGVIADNYLLDAAIELRQQYEMAVMEHEFQQVISNDHANILERLSNYYQNEGHKQDEARLAITEAIITGLGLLEPVVETPPGGGPRVPSCRFVSNRDFLVDPDASYWRDVTWIAIRRTAPRNIVERRFGLPDGYLKGMFASNTAINAGQIDRSKMDDEGKVKGVCHDIVEYYDVFSKNGAGQRLKIGDTDRQLQGLDGLGDFVYLAICPKCAYPLNLPDSVPILDELTGQTSEEALSRTAWPAPFWDDWMTDGGWPICRLTFYQNPGEVWPLSMCKPVLPEMKFVNWCMSFLADGVAAGSKIYVAYVKRAAENLRQQIAEGHGPFTPIEVEEITGQSIDDLVSFLQAPPFNYQIFEMLERVNERIDKGLGLTELMYGLTGKQMRSAAEASYRQNNINIRPDDMASRVEDWLSITATREIQLIRWLGTYEDVAPIVGPLAAQAFVTQILTQDVSQITREFRFRVEAGTARKPNKDTRIAQLNEIAQYLLPTAMEAMRMGVGKPFNAFMEDYARALDMDASRYILGEDDMAQVQYALAASAGILPEQLAARTAPRQPAKKESTANEQTSA